MRFKAFLKEMPVWGVGRENVVNCPHGDIIKEPNGANKTPEGQAYNDLYTFDFAVERFSKEQRDPLYFKTIEVLNNTYGALVDKAVGQAPFYCQKHDILFYYDFDLGKKLGGLSADQHSILSMTRQLMLNHDSHQKAGHKITIIS